MRSTFDAVFQNPYVRVLVTLLVAGGLYLFYLTLGVWMLALAAFLIAYLAYQVLVWSARRFRALAGCRDLSDPLYTDYYQQSRFYKNG